MTSSKYEYKQNLKHETDIKIRLMRFKNGVIETIKDWRRIITVLGIISAGVLIYAWYEDTYSWNPGFLDRLEYEFIKLFIILFTAFCSFMCVYVFGAPLKAWGVKRQLERIGFVNKAGESPYLLSMRNDEGSKTVIYKFYQNGIPLSEWEDRQADIEAAMNVNIAKIKLGRSRNEIKVYASDYEKAYPDFVDWADDLVSEVDFRLIFGEGFMGKYSIDLNRIPHILIGGSTGSGKSVLLKCLVWQSVLKGAAVSVADFKGGVDFNETWKNKVKLILDEDTLIEHLTYMVRELEFRKQRFREVGAKNIVEYNTKYKNMNRIIFACDEVAELLDKTGLSKQQKERVGEIENRLATIARQGRAFGINLILATQRPDANILSGQIRNNIDCRVCGRADDVLSKIILDNTDASEMIPKDEQGLFLTNDGVVIRGYYFKD